MDNQYEVLNPWAEIDPLPLKGIAPRLNDLAGKRIGLFCNSKKAALPIIRAVENQLRERFPTCQTTWYIARESFTIPQLETADKDKFIDWVKGVDAVVGAVGD